MSLRQSRFYSGRRTNPSIIPPSPGRQTCRQLLPSLLAVSGAATQRKTATANAPPSWVEKEMDECQSEDSGDGSAGNMSPGTFIGYYSPVKEGLHPTPPPQSMSVLDRSSSSSTQPSHTQHPASQEPIAASTPRATDMPLDTSDDSLILFSPPSSPHSSSSSRTNKSNASSSTGLGDDSGISLSSSAILAEVVEEVRKSTQMQQQMQLKMCDMEKQLHRLQQEGTSGGTERVKKCRPSREVRNRIRKIYSTLCAGDEQLQFQWNVKESFQHQNNRQVLRKLLLEAKAAMPDIPVTTLTVAAQTYFTSLSGKEKQKDCGRYEGKVTRQRKRNRMMRKLKRRQSAMTKTTSMTSEQKGKWSPCLIMDLMSSEESEEEADENGKPVKVFLTHQLPWRSTKVNQFFRHLDKKSCTTAQGRMMTMTRREGLPSDRCCPVTSNTGTGIPDWAIRSP